MKEAMAMRNNPNPNNRQTAPKSTPMASAAEGKSWADSEMMQQANPAHKSCPVVISLSLG